MSRRDTVMKYFNEQEEWLAEAQKGIEKHRKNDFTVIIKDVNGNLLPEVKLTVEQTGHEFNFGCNLFLLDEFETEEKNIKYRELFPRVFNYAVLPFYWGAIEPERGKTRFSVDSPKIYRRPAPDLTVDFCCRNNIRMKGHCLVYDKFGPDWLSDDVQEIKREQENYMKRVARRYADVIKDWDIINETLLWDPMDRKGGISPFFGEDDYVEWSLTKGAEYFPDNRKFINETTFWDRFYFKRTDYCLLLENLEYKHIPFDAIGLQCHHFAKREQEPEFTYKHYNPRRLRSILDTFGSFKKPLHISEVTIASYNGNEEDYALQAELLENMYRIWFSHENIDAIIYWNLVDGYTFNANGAGAGDLTSGENFFGGGLLYHDLSTKPAFETLNRLVNKEWRSLFNAETGADGRVSLRGFKGDYQIKAEKNGISSTCNAKISDGQNIIELILK